MKDTFVINFFARKSKSENDYCSIFIRVTLNKERKEFSSNYKILQSKWSQLNGQHIGLSSEAKIVNRGLGKIKMKLVDSYNELKFSEREISISQLFNVYNGVNKNGIRLNFLELFEEHNQRALELLNIDYSKSTYLRFEIIKKHVLQFLTTIEKIDIEIKELNIEFLNNLEHFLKIEKSLSHNSSIKYIRIVMKIARLGLKLRIIDKDPFYGYKQHLKDVKREFLNEDELYVLETKEFNNARLDSVRDVFVFCCYTGLSFIDAYNLTPQQIIRYPGGEYWINIYRQKTDGKSHIPLLPKAKEIVTKYKKSAELIQKSKVLPLQKNSKYNLNLKKIGALCEFTKTLSSHVARHTFATTVTLNNDVPLETVSSMLGHRNIRTTQIYAKVLDKKIGSDMKTLKKKLNQKAKSRL